VGVLQRREDRRTHAIEMAQHIRRREPQHAVSLTDDECLAPVVARLSGVGKMAAPVDLDDELRAMRCEVSEEAADRHLTAKMKRL